MRVECMVEQRYTEVGQTIWKVLPFPVYPVVGDTIVIGIPNGEREAVVIRRSIHPKNSGVWLLLSDVESGDTNAAADDGWLVKHYLVT